MPSHDLDSNIEYKRRRIAAGQEVERWLHEDPRTLGIFRKNIQFAAGPYEANERKLSQIRNGAKRRRRPKGPGSSDGVFVWDPLPWWRTDLVETELRVKSWPEQADALRAHYAILTAIHDTDLEGVVMISADVWPANLLKEIHQRLWGAWRDRTDLIQTALKTVEQDWRSFRFWRNESTEAAEVGGGKMGRIEMARLTSTYPVDVVSVASEIIEELAPIARDIADSARKPAAEQNTNGRVHTGELPAGGLMAEWDVFISHASEDREAFVRPLAAALQAKGIRVWLDELVLTVGDRLRRSIEDGLKRSRYGIVVISPDFLKKEWPQKELDGLAAREVGGHKVILPVWHNVDRETVLGYSPLLADRVASLSTKGVDGVVEDLMKVIQG